MNLCICGHDEGAHRNGTGHCYADKKNGDPCECKWYREQASPAVLPEQLGASQYIADEERQIIESNLVKAAAIGALQRGDIPDAITMHLLNKECGEQKSIKFELILEIYPCASGCRRLYYHAAGPFEFAGIPGQSWTVVI